MNIDERNNESKAYLGFRAAMDLFMGAVYIAVSVYVLKYPAVLRQFGTLPLYFFALVFSGYGLYRLYRGWQTMQRSMKR